MALEDILNITITAIFTAICALLFVRIWKFVNRELRTAPRFTPFQKFKNRSSAILFCLLVSLSAMFVLAIITSTIAHNALGVLGHRPIVRDVLVAFKFPTLLPFILIFITVFALLYSLYEYLSLADSGQGGPMEVQRWIEGKFIDPVHPPWSHFIAFMIFVVISLLTPIITSFITLKTWDIPVDVSNWWVVLLIFLDWLLLGPMFYLSYYARILGLHKGFLRARKVNLKKNKKYILIYITMGLLLISSISALITYLPILFGHFPEAKSPQDTITFLENLFDLFRFLHIYLDLDTKIIITNMVRTLPPDFLWFMITSMGFGLYGFYTKFISKEPLNSNKMVLFGAYLVCGIAASIFINTIIRWPQFFPMKRLLDLGLNLDLTQPADQQFVIRLFSPALLVEKILNIIFLLTFLFRRKDLRQNADEWALNQAILNQDFETVMEYVNHEQAEMRLLVADSVVRYMKKTSADAIPENTSKTIASIVDLLGGDDDPSVRKFMADNQEEIIAKLEIDSLIEGLVQLLADKNKKRSKQIIVIFNLIATDSIEKIVQVLNKLIAKKLTSDQIDVVFAYLKHFEKDHHNKVYNFLIQYITPQIAHSHPLLVLACMDYIKTHAISYRDHFDELSEKFIQLLVHPDPEIVALSLEVYSLIALGSTNHIALVMSQFNIIQMDTPDVIRQKIGAIVQFTSVEPKWFAQFFDYLEVYLNQTDPIYKADAALALGSISANVSMETFFEQIFPHLRDLVQNPVDSVRLSTITSLIFIAKTKPEVLMVEKFQHLFSVLMLDANVDVRHRIYGQYIQLDPYLLLNDISAVLMTPMQNEIRFDLLNTLAQMAPKIGTYIKEVDLLSKLLRQDFRDSQNIGKESIDNLQADKSRLFGFKRNIDEISIMEATISVLYEICFYFPEFYDTDVKEFLENNAMRSGALGITKTFEFYGKIAIEANKNKRWIALDININSTLQFINKHMITLNSTSQKVIVVFIQKLYAIDKGYHREILEILYGIINQETAPSVSTQDKVIRLLANVLSDHGDLYFDDITIRNLKTYKEISLNPFEDLFGPYLIEKLMIQTDPIIQTGAGAALLQIAKTPGKEMIVKDLILYTIKSRNSNLKISGMKALIIMPIEIEQIDIINLIKVQVSDKNYDVKASAIDVLGRIIRTYPTVHSNTKRKEKRIISSLIYRSLQYPYGPDVGIKVKQAILENLKTISLIQPEIPGCLKLLDDISTDPELSIAKQAVEILFDFIDLYPNKLENEVILHFRHLANHPSFEIQLMLIQKLLDLHADKVVLTGLIPTVLKLSTNCNPTVRNEGLSAFRTIFLSDPVQFNFCIDQLLSIISRSKTEVKRDSCTLLCKVMLVYANKLQDNVRIFITLEELARDYDVEINYIVTKYISDLSKEYPNRIDSFLQLTYIMLRKSDRKRRAITELALNNLQEYVQDHEEYRDEIISRLKRFFKKNQDPLLESAMNQIAKK